MIHIASLSTRHCEMSHSDHSRTGTSYKSMAMEIYLSGVQTSDLLAVQCPFEIHNG